MKKIPMAVQLYSVHKLLEQDFEGTIRKMAEIGFEGVEFFGGVKKDADRVNAILKETGLKVVGWHSGMDDLSDERIDQTIAFHKAIGNRFVVVPGLPAEMTESAAAWRNTAGLFKKAADRLRAEGIGFGYHNHAEEFLPLDTGELAWDILGRETDIILQLDNGNAMSGGADSLEFLKKYPGRARTIHLKPYSLNDGFDTMIGEDDVPWSETFRELDRQDATEWLIVEYESEALYEPVEGVRLCHETLRKMGV